MSGFNQIIILGGLLNEEKIVISDDGNECFDRMCCRQIEQCIVEWC